MKVYIAMFQRTYINQIIDKFITTYGEAKIVSAAATYEECIRKAFEDVKKDLQDNDICFENQAEDNYFFEVFSKYDIDELSKIGNVTIEIRTL